MQSGHQLAPKITITPFFAARARACAAARSLFASAAGLYG
jgi:hypothetical protein